MVDAYGSSRSCLTSPGPENGPKTLFDMRRKMSKTLGEPATGKRRRRLSGANPLLILGSDTE